MTNNEKALKLVQECLDDWPYAATRVVDIMTRLEKVKKLLKEQKPVKAVADDEDSYVCNNYGTVIGYTLLELSGIEEVKYKFCPECGGEVKWND